jgi:ribosomal protein S12 methylthiotransferase
VDSENIITQLEASKYDVINDSNDEAGTVVINTCGFIDKAKEESINTILQYADLKNQGKLDKLVVTGCLSERYKHDLIDEIPEVDAFFGTQDMPDLLTYLNAEYKHQLIGERKSSTPSHYAYLKIAEGCNRTCSFCAIPIMRGGHRSRSIEDLVRETRTLVSSGVKEIILIAQELTYYGLDLYKKRRLSDLLNALCEIDGLEWIRLHYAYPSKFPMDIIEVMRDQPKVCNYLDIPLQHASDDVLKSMRRQINLKDTMSLLKNIREMVPDIAIRTTMLLGFPGETDEDFEILTSFVRDQEFDRLGAFLYSHEEDTSAYDLKDDVSQEKKSERYNELMAIQADISFKKNLDKIGTRVKVLIDRKENDYFIGRTEYDSPEVDNEVLISASNAFCRIGDFRMIEITNAEEYDLYGVPID